MELAGHFAVKMAGELGLEVFNGFSEEARETLTSYDWPGNVRELKNVVERSVYSCLDRDKSVTEINLDPFESPWRPGQKPTDAVSGPARQSGPFDFKQRIQEQEILLIQDALEQCKYNQKKTAEFLGMTYHQLRGYLRKYELTEAGQ